MAYNGDVRGFDDDEKMAMILEESIGADEEFKPIGYEEDEPDWVRDE